MSCRINGKICNAWSDVAGCGLVRCKFMEKKDGGEILKGETVTDSHQMTNADRIRSMNDEELADFLAYTWATSARAWQKDPGETLHWLQQKAEDVNHE